MRNLLPAAFVTGALLLTAAVTAQQPQQPPPQDNGKRPGWVQGPTIVAEPIALTLAGFDANQDAIVTRAEAIAGAAHSFAAAANGARDIGYIGYGDWAVRWLGDANALPSQYEVDADRDNRITAAELSAALLFAFDRFDKDHDARLTRAELVTIRATMFGNDRPDDRKGKRKGGGGQPPPQR